MESQCSVPKSAVCHCVAYTLKCYSFVSAGDRAGDRRVM